MGNRVRKRWRWLNTGRKRTVDGGLTRELLEHLGGTSKSVTRLADRDVQDELLDAELPHGVLGLLRLRNSMSANTKVPMRRIGGFVPSLLCC